MSEWISAIHSEPKEFGNAYIVCYQLEKSSPIMAIDAPVGKCYVFQLFFTSEGWSFDEFPVDRETGASNLIAASGLVATHWQPLPAPPTESEAKS